MDRWLPRRLPGDLVVKSSARLTPHHSVHQVDWNGKRLLIGCANQSIMLLSELSSNPDTPAEPSAQTHNTHSVDSNPKLSHL
ncbi:flagellar biosynthetic protein FliO [Comamonas odontotermitis]|uniref:flagellar biosynthetic protein FliO n=1 Tax=Comamonas odontotermitis TaxID=379895 RepID=UPI00366DD0FD